MTLSKTICLNDCNVCDDPISSSENLGVINRVVKSCLVIVYLVFIHASTDQGYKEEGGYYEEEAEENFNHCTAQGKPILATLQASLYKLT